MAVMVFFGVFAALLATVAFVSILNGWVLTILWGWFMVPFGLPALSLPVAIGVALVVSFMTHQYHRSTKSDKEGWDAFGDAAAHIILRPFLALLMGYIVKQFI